VYTVLYVLKSIASFYRSFGNRETENLNLSLFISEIVGAIASTLFKATDVNNMVLVKLIQQSYQSIIPENFPILSIGEALCSSASKI